MDLPTRTRATSPRPRRVLALPAGLVLPSLSSSSRTPTSPPVSPPLLPARSPLRPAPRGSSFSSAELPPPLSPAASFATASSTTLGSATTATHMGESTIFNRASFQSMNGHMQALTAKDAWTPEGAESTRTLSMLADMPALPSYEPERSAPTPPAAPKVAKRVHALLELLSSERAYASDLAITRDYHIPMASGALALFAMECAFVNPC